MEQKTSVVFVGDISFNDAYVDYYKAGINPFSELESILNSNDAVVGNLECMAKGEFGENLLKNPRLTTTVDTLNYLKKLNVKLVALAQNHVYDHLEDGFIKTTEFLSKNNIGYLGASTVSNEEKKPFVFSHNGINIGFLNFVTADTNPKLPENSKINLNFFDLEQAIDDIKKLKTKVNHVVVMMHWGGRVEGGLYPDFKQPQIAKSLIDAGADLIIGHHTHTLQPYEIYKGKYIFYSLGNFCFSDVMSGNVLHPLTARRKITTLVTVNFEKNGAELCFDFFYNNGKSFTKINYSKKIKRRNFNFKIISKNFYLWCVYFIYLKKILPLFQFIIRKDLTTYQKIKRISNSISKRLSIRKKIK